MISKCTDCEAKTLNLTKRFFGLCVVPSPTVSPIPTLLLLAYLADYKWDFVLAHIVWEGKFVCGSRGFQIFPGEKFLLAQ